MLNRVVRVALTLAWCHGLLSVFLCGCSGVPIGGSAGGAGGTGGGGTVVVSPPDQPCAFVATPPTATSNPSCPQGTYTGNVKVDGPEDIAQLAGCTRLIGDLDVGGLTLESVRGLEALRVVEGKLTLLVGSAPCAGFCPGMPRSPLLTSLRGLDELRCVGGDMGMVTASPPLVDASGLGKLSDVEGSLQVYSFGLLVQPLPALTRVYGDVNVPGANVVPALTTVYGGMRTTTGPVQPGAFPRLSYIGCGSSYPPCRDGVLGCDFEASGQSAAASLTTCKYALQDVTLSGTDLTSSNPLQQLRQVRGVLAIQGTGLVNLNGLADLERAGALVITDNPALRNVDALDGIILGYGGKPFPGLVEPNGAVNEYGGIKLTNNPALTGVSWPNLRVEGAPGSMWLTLAGNTALTSLGNWPWLTEAFRLTLSGSPLTSVAGLQALKTSDALLLSDLPSLTSLAGLHNLEHARTLGIVRTGITHVDALSRLTELEGIGIESCRALTSVTGLRSLQRVTSGFSLADVPALTSLRGLEALQSANSLYIAGAGIPDLTGLSSFGSAYRIALDNCPRLTSLSGLTSLQELSELTLSHLPVFTSLAALAPVSPTSLFIEDLPALTSLSGFNASPSLFVVQLQRVPALRNLRGLDRATQISTLDIEDAGSLTTLDGLGALEQVGQSLELTRTALESLRALTSLRSVNNGPAIYGNPRLSDCELRWLFERIGYTPPLPIEDPAVSNAGPRNCTLTAPVVTPGLVWSKFFERTNESVENVHLMPDNRLAVIGVVQAEPVFTPPPGTPQPPRPPAGSVATSLRLLSPTGSLLSSRLLGNFSGEYQAPSCSNVDASGRITVVALELLADGSEQTAQFRFASDGSLLGERRQPALPQSRCALDDNGNVYLNALEAALVTKQAPDGSVLWQRTVPVPAELGDGFWAMPHGASSGVLLHLGGAPGTNALVRVLDDGRVAWTRLLRGSVLDFTLRMVMAPDGQVTVLGVAQSDVSTDGSATRLNLPDGASDLPFLLRLRSDGSVASLRAFPDAMANGRIALGPDGSLYVANDGYNDAQPTPAALYKFDTGGNLVFKRNLGPLLAGWTGFSTFGSSALIARADRVILAAQAAHADGFLAQFTP